MISLPIDVIGMVAEDMSPVVTYEYDAWGKLLNVSGEKKDTVGKLNPFRYRGYVYEEESGLYYVSSRYYDPEVGRFLNADSQLNQQEGVTGYNMFAYCGNNPVNRADPTGHAFMFLTAAIGAVAGAIVGGVVAAATGKSVLAGVAIGAAAGGLIALTCGAAAGVMLAGSATASTAAVMAGGSALVATVSAGGLGAGAMYVAENVSRAINSAGTALYSGGEKALQAARDSGGKVINDSIGKAAEIITKDMPWEQAKPVWESFSSQFCQQASGTVNAYVCNSAYQGVNSVFWSVEMPALLNNPRVTDIVIHIFE